LTPPQLRQLQRKERQQRGLNNATSNISVGSKTYIIVALFRTRFKLRDMFVTITCKPQLGCCLGDGQQELAYMSTAKPPQVRDRISKSKELIITNL
jgi:hypothetical protein